MIIAIGLLSLVPSLRPAFAIEEQKPYNVEFRDANIKSAIRLLAKIDGRNVVVPTSVDGQVTASFQGVNVEDALQAVLKTNGYGMILENNIFQVFPQKDMASLGEDLLTSAYDLKYAKAQDILPHVESLLTERGSAIADERTNAVHIRDTKAAVDNIVELIDKLDRKGKQVLIEAKIIEASVDFIRSLGVQWGVTKTGGKIQSAGLTTVGTADSGR